MLSFVCLELRGRLSQIATPLSNIKGTNPRDNAKRQDQEITSRDKIKGRCHGTTSRDNIKGQHRWTTSRDNTDGPHQGKTPMDHIKGQHQGTTPMDQPHQRTISRGHITIASRDHILRGEEWEKSRDAEKSSRN
jgi:hypothetical protein